MRREISHGCQEATAREDDTHAWLVRKVVCRFRSVVRTCSNLDLLVRTKKDVCANWTTFGKFRIT